MARPPYFFSRFSALHCPKGQCSGRLPTLPQGAMWGKINSFFFSFYKKLFSQKKGVVSCISGLGPRKFDRADQTTLGSGLRMSGEVLISNRSFYDRLTCPNRWTTLWSLKKNSLRVPYTRKLQTARFSFHEELQTSKRHVLSIPFKGLLKAL